MQLTKSQRNLHLHMLIGFLDSSRQTIGAFYDKELLRRPDVTDSILEVLKFMDDLKFEFVEENTVNLHYHDKFSGPVTILNEKTSSQTFCYYLMNYYSSLRVLIMRALDNYNIKEWPCNELFKFEAELSVRLHTIFS